MSEFWNNFLFHFCKADLFCRQGEPNWLGWILIGIVAFVLVYCLLTSLFSIISWLFQLYPASYEDEIEEDEIEEDEIEEDEIEVGEGEEGEIIKLDEAKKALTTKKGKPTFRVNTENNNDEET